MEALLQRLQGENDQLRAQLDQGMGGRDTRNLSREIDDLQRRLEQEIAEQDRLAQQRDRAESRNDDLTARSVGSRRLCVYIARAEQETGHAAPLWTYEWLASIFCIRCSMPITL